MLIYLSICISIIIIYLYIQYQYNHFNQNHNNHMHRLLIGCYRFSTILQILHRNKTELKSINKTHISIPTTNTHQLTRNRLNILPYMSINHEYICQSHLLLANQFRQLNVYANKLLPNQALANGQDFQDYPMQKLIHICLKHVLNGTKDENIWVRLQKRVNKLMRDSSPVDNIILLYISTNRWSKQLQAQIVDNIRSQIKLMSQLQHQFLFYTICQILQQTNTDTKNQQHRSKLNKIKQQLMSNIKKSKLNISTLVQWILLISIVNAPHVNVQGVLKYIDKVHLYSNNNNVISIQQFYCLLSCLESRAILVQQYQMDLIRNRGKNLIYLFNSKVSNSDIMIRGMKDKQRLRIKMILSYYNPQNAQGRLTNQQLLSNTIDQRQIVRYIHWLWKNNFLQEYQIKSLYPSIQIQLELEGLRGRQAFRYLDFVYYCCWIQMAVQDYKRYKDIIHICNNMEYIPRGLEWPLWNYLAQITKNKLPITSQQKQSIQSIINKIKNIDKQRQKPQKIQQLRTRLKNQAQIKQLQKFFHEIKLWNWKICQPIGSLDYVVHFINHQIKIIINCISYVHYCQPYSTQQFNNEHLLNKKLLKQNFGYAVVDLHVGNFMQMNYNDRIQWLRDNIGAFSTKKSGYLQQQ